jgi:hypothetical protein
MYIRQKVSNNCHKLIISRAQQEAQAKQQVKAARANLKAFKAMLTRPE